MATSGVYTVQYTRDQLITASLRKLGVLAEGQTPSSQNLTDGAMALNAAVAELRTIKVPLWERGSYSFTPTAGTQSYTIGTGQTLNIVAPLHILQAYRQDASNNTKIPMEIISDYNFNQYPVSSSGTSLQLTYQPFINYGVIKLWPIPDSTSTTINIVYTKPFQYFTSGTDTMDFPEEFYNGIIYKTAVLLAPEWGIPLQDRQLLKAEATEYLANAISNGEEDAVLLFSPRRR